MLGSTELRALASARGDELARLALTHAVEAPPTDAALVERAVAGGAGPARHPGTARPRAGRAAGRPARQRPPVVRGPGRRRVDQHARARAGPAGEGHPAPPAPGRRHERHGAGERRPRRRTAGRRGRRRVVRGAVRSGRSAAFGRGHRRPGPGVRRGQRRRRPRGGRLRTVRAAPGCAWPAGPARRHPGPPPGGVARAIGRRVRPRDRSSSHRPPPCTRRRGGCCPPWPAYPSRSCPRRRPGCAPGDRELGGTAGCSSLVRGWRRGERRSRWWPPSIRTPWC